MSDTYRVRTCIDCPFRLEQRTPVAEPALVEAVEAAGEGEEAYYDVTHECRVMDRKVSLMQAYDLPISTPPAWCPLRSGPVEVRLG